MNLFVMRLDKIEIPCLHYSSKNRTVRILGYYPAIQITNILNWKVNVIGHKGFNL